MSTSGSADEQINSIGMRFVRIEAGRFIMGLGETPVRSDLGPLNCPTEHPEYGDFDEFPMHVVTISRPFHMSACEVTNAQYEQFDPSHKALRGERGFSAQDDEAVVFVSWHDAVRFCEWLSKKEGKPYRLPTEAEWEYACRAGTTTQFNTGDLLPEVYHKNNRIPKWEGPAWYPDPKCLREQAVVSLVVGSTPPNAWGLHDMHGNVEEWCGDWYGPYEAEPQVDPVGRADGDFRVTRGGSHSTDLYFLRSANRMAMLPDDRNWLIGFRVALGEAPATPPLPAVGPSAHQIGVKQTIPPRLAEGPDPSKPYFKGPRRYVKVPPNSYGPMYSRHSHDPGICACPNGDLLAIWFSCIDEPGREHCHIASRLRRGNEEWDVASPFWDPPDRNSHAPAVWVDEEGTICHFAGIGAQATWGGQALLIRTSRDNGATWSRARIVDPEHGPGKSGRSRHMPVESVFRAQDGAIVLPCDANEGTVLHISRDNGRTWPEAPGVIAGIHAGVAQLKDGRLMAFGRHGDIDSMMPKSVSEDMGKTWTYSASCFPPIGQGQRLVLKRLTEGPLFFASFVGTTMIHYPAWLRELGGVYMRSRGGENMKLTDAAGKERSVSGVFAALSFDEGETWPVRKLITGEGPARVLGLTYASVFTMDANTGEPGGYMAACQSRDRAIHLITSQRHYAFNLAWLKEPMAAEAP